jgi:hypothetical protein
MSVVLRAFGLLSLRLLALLAILGGISVLVFEALGLFDLFGFEYAPLLQLIGWRGVLFIIALDVGLIVFISRLLTWLRNYRPRRPLLTRLILGIWALLLLWLLEWMFMETPLTLRVASSRQKPAPIELTGALAQDFGRFSLAQGVKDPAAREKLAVMYERIRVNTPEAYAANPLGATLDKYAVAYDVDPEVLFFFLYVGSFWGEAVSGQVPFLNEMTSETIRDLVQIHVPGWFIESGLRRQLIESHFLEQVAGTGFGWKLRYAFHKTTLDVSTQPYDINIFSDLVLVLQQYPNAFPELSSNDTSDPVVTAFRDSYRAIGARALVAPYEQPYASPPLDAAWYSANRQNLKKFTRAAYYRLVLDFDFATRVGALIVKYQGNYYAKKLGAQRWNAIPRYERASMLAMTRDLYMPNVGHLGPNLYALGEINCTPVEFVAAQAVADPEGPGASEQRVWRPKDYLQLWGGASTKLRIFNELWQVLHAEPMPGLDPENTVDDARRIVRLADRKVN